MSGSDEFRGIENPYALPLTPPTAPDADVAEESEEKSLRAFVGAEGTLLFEQAGSAPRCDGQAAGSNWAAFFLSGRGFPTERCTSSPPFSGESFSSNRLPRRWCSLASRASRNRRQRWIPDRDYLLSPASAGRSAIAGICARKEIIAEVESEEPDCEARLRTIAKRGGTSLAASLGFFVLFILLIGGVSFALDIMLHLN